MLDKKFQSYKIILGSGSPRRKKFLEDLGLEFTIKTSNVEEVYPKYLHGSEITNYLAELKANAYYGELDKKDILITADTIVRFNGKVLGKPKDLQQAKDMLTDLSGNVHEVISSICIKTKSKQVTFSDTTYVHFKDLTQDEIEYYVHKFKPLDKAGAYGIQEWLGFMAVEKLEGSYFNVMGFPVHKFYKEMMKL